MPRLPVQQTCPIGNPVIPGTGTKLLVEHDDAGDSDLALTHAYRSYVPFGVNVGSGKWLFNWQRTLDTNVASYISTPQIRAWRADGSVSYFQQNGATWTAADTRDTLQPVTGANGNVTGWQYMLVDTGAVETYDADGKLQSVRERSGRTTTLTYNAAGQLAAVTSPSGRSLTFAYDSQGRVSSVATPDGAITRYSYDANSMLSVVTRPDGTTRQYLYEDSRFVTALTGIIDENGNRHATYIYDNQGRTVSSGHAGGADLYQFQYGANNQTTVTDPSGKTSTYAFLKQNGVLVPTSISAPCGLCGSTRQSSSYDANNNLIQETDYLGNVTSHAYDSQKREIQRVEGAGTPNARTITTVWHPQFSNLPTQIAVPTKLQNYSYDGNGNLIGYSETPTADTTGSQGIGAAATGPTRTQQWTYNASGQVLTASGPRTDVNDGNTYVYRTADDTSTPPQYRKGDLHSVTDALGHTSTIGRYDPNGRPLQMTDTNGTVTTFAYSNRGWLTSRTVTPAGGSPQTTSYKYDGVGQLTQAALPDGSSVSFTYDGAHRMTGAADSLGNSLGNSITYTLDAMGNRLQDQVTDSSGNLARQIERVFDSMNRPLQVRVGTSLPTNPGPATGPLVKVTPAAVTASGFYSDSYTPVMAIDGNPSTVWLTPLPTQWIEVDLGVPVVLRSIRMLVNQSPAGQTTHIITGGVGPAPTNVLQTLSGTTADQQWLTFTPSSPLSPTRFIRITTTVSPSWVSWRELEFYQ